MHYLYNKEHKFKHRGYLSRAYKVAKKRIIKLFNNASR